MNCTVGGDQKEIQEMLTNRSDILDAFGRSHMLTAARIIFTRLLHTKMVISEVFPYRFKIKYRFDLLTPKMEQNMGLE